MAEPTQPVGEADAPDGELLLLGSVKQDEPNRLASLESGVLVNPFSREAWCPKSDSPHFVNSSAETRSD
jgi:hypothetical protein